MHRWSQRLPYRIVVAAVLILSAVSPFLPVSAEAAQFNSAFLRLDRMKVNTATGGQVCADVVAAHGTETDIIITFPSTYTLNTTAANWIVDDADLPVGATFWPGMTTGVTTASAVSNAAHTATFPSSDITVDGLYCFNFAAVNTLTTAAVAANSQQALITTKDSGPSIVDETPIALANNTDDTIVITAVVPPSFIMTLSAYTDTFASNLDPLAVVSTAGVTSTFITNAKGGWIAWAKDLYQGLQSAAAAHTIPAFGTVADGNSSQLVPGTEGYVMDVVLTTDATDGCIVGLDADYDGTTQAQPTRSGGTLAATYQPVASCTGTSGTPATGTANGDVISLVERAAISGVTPAGTDYTDSITVVGAGNF